MENRGEQGKPTGEEQPIILIGVNQRRVGFAVWLERRRPGLFRIVGHRDRRLLQINFGDCTLAQNPVHSVRVLASAGYGPPFKEAVSRANAAVRGLGIVRAQDRGRGGQFQGPREGLKESGSFPLPSRLVARC